MGCADAAVEVIGFADAITIDAYGDVTSGYIVVNTKRLCGPVELGAARILELAHVKR